MAIWRTSLVLPKRFDARHPELGAIQQNVPSVIKIYEHVKSMASIDLIRAYCKLGSVSIAFATLQGLGRITYRLWQISLHKQSAFRFRILKSCLKKD
jgi:hypothetical protein